jgi:hypothetical protein
MELFINYSESKGRAFVGKIASGSMKVTYCSETKSVSTHDLQKGSIALKIRRVY